MENEILYNTYMELIGKFTNEELIKLGKDLIEYAENDNLF